MKFRKKPVVIEAFRWDPNQRNRKVLWFQEALDDGRVYPRLDMIDIVTPEGTMTAQPGDWIIKGVEGELYPCKDSVFRATYESVDGSYLPLTIE